MGGRGINSGTSNIGDLIIRTGFWGPLFSNHNREHPKIV